MIHRADLCNLRVWDRSHGAAAQIAMRGNQARQQFVEHVMVFVDVGGLRACGGEPRNKLKEPPACGTAQNFNSDRPLSGRLHRFRRKMLHPVPQLMRPVDRVALFHGSWRCPRLDRYWTFGSWPSYRRSKESSVFRFCRRLDHLLSAKVATSPSPTATAQRSSMGTSVYASKAMFTARLTRILAMTIKLGRMSLRMSVHPRWGQLGSTR